MDEKHKIGFVYTVEHYRKDGTLKSIERVHNIIPTVGIDYILNAAIAGGAQFSTWYLGLFQAAYTPLMTDTMTTILASCDEVIPTAGTRATVAFPAVDAGIITTLDDPNIWEFTEATTVSGALLTSNPTAGNTTGLLLSAVRFSSPKVMADGEYLRVPVGITLASL